MSSAPETVVLLIGPILIAACLSWLLWGILTVQIYYYVSFFKDSWHLRSLVYGLYFVASVQVFVNMDSAFDVLCNNWGNFEKVIAPGWTCGIMPAFSGIVSFPVQAFFLSRIWKLRATWKAPWAQTTVKCIVGFVTLCALAQAVGSLITAAMMIEMTDMRDISGTEGYIALWLAGSAFCDTAITITLLLLLRSAGKKTEWPKTKNLIDRVIQQTVQTGLIVTVAAVAEFILFLVPQRTYLHGAIACVGGTWYSNSLLASLNSRAWKRTQNGYLITTLPESTVIDTRSGKMIVHVNRVQEEHLDSDSATKIESQFNA